MEWRSDQYIGTGGRSLDFISTNMPGFTQSSGETVAELVRAARNEVIESRLYIRIQSGIINASVLCQDVGTGMTASVEFRLAGMCTSKYLPAVVAILFHRHRWVGWVDIVKNCYVLRQSFA